MANEFFTHKMHLYLKSGESERWLTVQLVDGHIPRIAGLSDDDTLAVSDNLEPAIWFRVMVLQSITIDCDKRVACWRNATIDKTTGEPLTHWLSGEDSFYDWDDDIDELFNLACTLVQENPLAEPNEESRREKIIVYEQNLFKMLHCYVLPRIQLYPADLESVNNALKAQNKAISQLEDVTLMHTRLAEHYMTQMRNIREVEVLPMLDELVNGGQVSEELFETLMYDIKKAEPALRNEINQAQLKVDNLKEAMSKGAVSRKITNDLAEARRTRDQVHQSLANLLMGKALAQTSLDIAQQVRDMKIELNESCSQYVRLYRRVKEEKMVSTQTLDKKLRALGVRECILSVIKDLEKDSPTYGEDPEIKETKPEWQTLNQRISSIVHNKEHPVGIKFKNFTQELQLNYQKIMRTTANIVYGSSRFMTSYNEFYVISEQDLGLNKVFLTDQCNVVLQHLYMVSELLSEHFSKRTQMFMRKVRLCYEKCFFNRIGRDLILVYRVVHGKVMQTIEARVNALRELSVCKLGLQMRDEWWLELFEPDHETNSFEYSEPEMSDASNTEGRSYEGEFGDDESTSDISDEDFCSDDESGACKMPMNPWRVPITDPGHKEITQNLLRSKNKVLSRSLQNLHDYGMNLIEASTKLLEDRFEKTAFETSPELNVEVFGRYLADEIDEKKEHNIRENIRRSQSVNTILHSESSHGSRRSSLRRTSIRHAEDTFEKHFGSAISQIRCIFTNSSPLKKMQCLTNALRTVSEKIVELRLRLYEEGTEVDRSKVAVSADDLLPLLVLLLLKMEPHDVAKLYTELIFISDLMADFLSSGVHSYALCEFHIAFRVLDQTCEELQL
eukprot:TCONS_00071375-protein